MKSGCCILSRMQDRGGAEDGASGVCLCFCLCFKLAKRKFAATALGTLSRGTFVKMQHRACAKHGHFPSDGGDGCGEAVVK